MAQTWNRYKLQDLAKRVTVGFVGSMAKEYVPSGVPMLRSQNIKPFKLDLNNLKFISNQFHNKISKSSLKKGDVAVIRTGNPGTACVISDRFQELNCSDLVIVTPDRRKINPHFLCYYFNSVASGYVNAQLVGAVQQHFNVGSAKKMEINLPPIEEQEEIVEIIKSLQDKIELNLQMNKTLEDMAMTLYKHWFVDFGPFQEGEMVDSELGKIPKGWEVKRLGELILNKRENRSEQSISDEENYIGLQHIDRGSLSILRSGVGGEVSSNKSAFSKGDILFGKLRPYFKKIGVAPFDGICSTDILVINPKAQPDFGYVLFTIFNDTFIDYTTTVSGGTRMPRVSWSDIKEYKIAVQKSNELSSGFNLVVESFIAQILANVSENQTLTTLRDTLLPKLISGEVRVKEAEKIITQAL